MLPSWTKSEKSSPRPRLLDFLANFITRRKFASIISRFARAASAWPRRTNSTTFLYSPVGWPVSWAIAVISSWIFKISFSCFLANAAHAGFLWRINFLTQLRLISLPVYSARKSSRLILFAIAKRNSLPSNPINN